VAAVTLTVAFGAASPALGASWSTIGNAGTDPATNFLGTIDKEPLIIKVRGDRVFRLEPTSGVPNVIGAFARNSITHGAVGATIAGGGDPTPNGQNRVTDS
jgi:trimeric autotransporter adhesin